MEVPKLVWREKIHSCPQSRRRSGMSASAVNFEATLKAFYTKVDPGKLCNVPSIVAKYAQDQRSLFKFLENKYRVEVALVFDVTDDAEDAFFQRLDVYSNFFDPEAALAAPMIPTPFPDTKPLDRLSQFRKLLPPNHEDFIAPSTAISRAGGAKKKPPPRAKKVVDIYTDQLAEKYTVGPLSLLKRAFAEHRQVTVWIRRLNGVKGTCLGYLEAFDKHFNMVMSDVHEEFLMFDHYNVVTSPKDPKKKYSEPALKPRKRYFKRVFIRGDNVVMVSIVPSSSP